MDMGVKCQGEDVSGWGYGMPADSLNPTVFLFSCPALVFLLSSLERKDSVAMQEYEWWFWDTGGMGLGLMGFRERRKRFEDMWVARL